MIILESFGEDVVLRGFLLFGDLKMTNLINITLSYLDESYIQSVSARELYLGLGLMNNKWARWSKTNISDNEFFTQGIDFVELPSEGSGNVTKDFAVSLRFAQHIAMMAKTDKAHHYRDYFIECEKQLKESREQSNQKYIHRQIAREEAYPMLDAYDDCAEENNVPVGNFDHSSEFDMLNSIVLGLTAQGYKYQNKIPLHESSIRDYLSPLQLEAIAFLQNANTLMLNEGEIDRPVRKDRLQKLFDKKFATRFERELLRLQF
jgi:phage anti-repressor protein